MIVKGENYIPAWRKFIENDAVRDAFDYLVDSAEESQIYYCELHETSKKDFRFYDKPAHASERQQPLSFIVNKATIIGPWILFYFRPPAIRSGKYSEASLKKDFGEKFSRPKKRNGDWTGEWTIKLHDKNDCILLLDKHIKL